MDQEETALDYSINMSIYYMWENTVHLGCRGREGGREGRRRVEPWSEQGAGFIPGRAGLKKRKEVSCVQMAGKKEAEQRSVDAV